MRLIALGLSLVLLAGAAKADTGRDGGFDYYVMALSWSPNWCAQTGDSRGDPQCNAGPGLTFTLHGLWPQYDAGGYPSACRTGAADPTRAQTAAMADLMGGAGLAWHEWKTHGRCSGLEAGPYFAAMRKAYTSVTVPPLFAKVARTLKVAPGVIEAAFLESNPQLAAEDIAVTCAGAMIQEVRICLTRDLAPRPCGPDVRACTLPAAELDAVR
jgi:ribonuclease T2